MKYRGFKKMNVKAVFHGNLNIAVITAFLLSSTALTPNPAIAANEWNVDNGEWATDSSWSYGHAPDASDSVHIDNDGTANITSGTANSNYSSIGYTDGKSGTVNVDGDGSLWASSNQLSVGEDGTGTLNINNSGDVTNIYGFIGRYSTSTGTVNVDGDGSKWISICWQ